jgi:hypothetical protein
VAELDPNVGNVSDSTGLADGILSIRVIQGVFKFANSATTDLLSIVHRGRLCYLVDDQTVAKTNGSGSRIPAGIVEQVDSAGLVDVFLALQQGLLARMGDYGAPQEIPTTGTGTAISLNSRTTRIAVSGTMAFALADGLVGGERKRFYIVSVASTPSAVVTPAHASGFTTITFGASTAGASVDLEWDDTLATPAWKVVGQNANGGTLTIA